MRSFLSPTALALSLMAGAAVAQAPAADGATQAPPAAGAQSPPGAATPAAPAAGAGVTVGASVKGPDGSAVGTIEAVDAQYATLATANTKAKLPLNAFAQRPEGLVIGMTAAQLEQAAGAAGATAGAATAGQQAAAAATPGDAASGAAGGAAKLAAGTTVNDTKGAPVGKIEEVSGDFAVVATAKNKVRLPLTAFADTPGGPIIGMTEAELDAAADAAKPK